MADTWAPIGTGFPRGGNLSPIYTVPPDRKFVMSTLQICNTGGIDTTFSVSIARNNAADHASQYLYCLEPLRANRAFTVTTGWTLSEGCVLRVFSTSGLVAFNLFGEERDA